MLEHIGFSQIAALILLAQRGAEEWHSAKNTRRLLDQGASEEGADFYPVVAVTHLAWIASLFLLIPANTDVIWPLITLYLALQIARYWIIFTLGPYWTHRIITLPGAPIEKKGPYRFVRHPNYVVTLLETLILPLAFGQVFLGFIMTAIWGAVIHYKILLEDAALKTRRLAQSNETNDHGLPGTG